MASLNKIRLYPLNFNQILQEGVNDIVLEEDAFVPPGWTPPPGVVPIGGSDVKAVLEKPQSTTG